MKNYSPKLDIISENIIYLLSLNSRISISDLSNVLGINRRIVENRYKKLFQIGFIKPLLIFNYPSITKLTILLKLAKFDSVVLKDITQISKFVKVKETLGNYDLSLLCIVENKNQIQIILNKINKLLHNSIINMDIIYHDIEDTLGYKSFCHNHGLIKKNELLFNESYELNKEEHIMLNILKNNPLISYSDLIKETNWNYKKNKEIIDRLSANNVIRFSVDPDYIKLGLEFHNILIKINMAKRKEFENKIIMHPRIHWLKRGTGPWDYILSITSKSIQEFIEISREIRTDNKYCILNFNSLISNIHVVRKG